jgi:hypothetical protein
MSERPDPKPKRIFKRFRFTELSLVDEPCVHGSDVVVIKAKKADCPTDGCTKLKGHVGNCGSTAADESDTSQSPTGHMDGGGEKPDLKEVRKRLEPLGALNDALAANEITPTEFVAKARDLVEALEDETRDGEPIQKMAAAEAATIIAETAMTLAEMQAALDTANTAIQKVEEVNKGLTAKVTALETERDEAVAKAKTAETERDEAVAKAKEAKPADEPSEEDVLKAMPPAARAIVMKAKELIASSETRENEALVERAVAKAKKLGVKDPDAVGKAMVDVRKAAPDAALVIDAALEQAAALVAESAVLKSLGYSAGMNGGSASDDPEAELKAKAEDIRKAKPDLSYEEAYSEAVEANPAVYNAYVAKRRSITVAH